MEKHYGKIVEYVVRKNGFSITDLAAETFVNRRSIYNWFNQKHLKSDIIYRIGCVIRHDFSNEFPELFHSHEFGVINEIKQSYSSGMVSPPNIEDEAWKHKYIMLLEKYNSMLIKKQIAQILLPAESTY